MKKLLTTILALFVVCSVIFSFAACGGSNNNGSDNSGAGSGQGGTGESATPQNPPTTSTGATITKSEWTGMLQTVNFMATGSDGGYLLCDGVSFKMVEADGTVTYYVFNGGEYFMIDGTSGEKMATDKMSCDINGLVFNNALETDDYDSLSYDETAKAYSLTKNNNTYVFTFVNGRLGSATVGPMTFTLSAYGSTSVYVPSFGGADSEEDGGSTTVPEGSLPDGTTSDSTEKNPTDSSSSDTSPDYNDLISSDVNETKKAFMEEGFIVTDEDTSGAPFVGILSGFTAEKTTGTSTIAYQVAYFDNTTNATEYYNIFSAYIQATGGEIYISDTIVWAYLEWEDTADSSKPGTDIPTDSSNPDVDNPTDSSNPDVDNPTDSSMGGDTEDSDIDTPSTDSKPDVDDPSVDLPNGRITKEQWAAFLEMNNLEAYSPYYDFTLFFGGNALFLPEEFMGMEMYLAEIDGTLWAIMSLEGQYVGTSDFEEFPLNSLTLGSILLEDYFNADSYDELTYEEEKGCYSITITDKYGDEVSYEFYFVDGVISVVNQFTPYDEDKVEIKNICTTVVEIPEFTDINDMRPSIPENPDARTEITEEEWEANINMSNVTINVYDDVYYDLGDNGYMVTSNTGSILLIFEDGTLYTYVTDENGEFVLNDEKYVNKYYMDINLILFGGELNANSYYDLVYDETEKCYILGDNKFYFQDGVLVFLNDGILFENHGSVVVGLPGEEDSGNSGTATPSKGDRVTKEEWAAMLELDNFVATVGNLGDPDYVETICNGDVAHLTDRIENNMYFVQRNGSTFTVIYMEYMGGYVGMNSGALTPLNVGSLILADCFSADSYDYIDFDEEKGCYTGQFFVSDLTTRYSIYFTDGVLSYIAVSSEDSTGEMVYEFSSLDEVGEIEVPNYQLLN